MSNPILIRLEVRGRPQDLCHFRTPMKELEKAEASMFYGLEDTERTAEEWGRTLEIQNRDTATIYSWVAYHPDRFIRSLAIKHPEITFVVTMTDEAESFIGTTVLINETLANSYSEFPSDAHDPNPTETPQAFYRRRSEVIEAISFLNYQKALAKLALKPL